MSQHNHKRQGILSGFYATKKSKEQNNCEEEEKRIIFFYNQQYEKCVFQWHLYARSLTPTPLNKIQ